MSVDKYEQGATDTTSQATPEPYPWCLACGFQHAQEAHCAGCNGDHSAGYCMTDELATQLASVGQLRQLVARASDRPFVQVLRMLRSQGGE
jgi:hypothetical protein